MEVMLVGVTLAEEKFEGELCYRVAISVLFEMRRRQLITAKEFRQIEPILARKFSPVWAGLSNVLNDKSA